MWGQIASGDVALCKYAILRNTLDRDTTCSHQTPEAKLKQTVGWVETSETQLFSLSLGFVPQLLIRTCVKSPPTVGWVEASETQLLSLSLGFVPQPNLLLIRQRSYEPECGKLSQ